MASVTARPYRSPVREQQARQTRAGVLAAASTLFVRQGFAGTTMRAVAAAAGVSVQTVELVFGTKRALLEQAIDVAIAGDDEPVPVLERAWARRARGATDPAQLLEQVAGVVGAAQARSAGLVLAAFEGARTDAGLAALADELSARRETTARWIVDTLARMVPLRPEQSRESATDTVWVLMDPAVFERLVRRRGWTVEQYESWWACSVLHLLTTSDPSNRRHP